MGQYAIGALVLLAAGLGLAYVTVDRFTPEPGPEQAAVAETPSEETSSKDQAAADPAASPTVTGSADRRMDDFGTGPSGTTVTVPLKDRYKQAYAGGGSSVGGSGQASDRSEPEIAALAPEGEEGEASSSENADSDPGYRVIERETEGSDAADAEAGTIEADDEVSPSFDVVRVDPTGRSVLAGRAAPLTDVEVKVGGEVVDRVTSTATGEWVSTPLEPLGSGDQELSLTAVDEDDRSVDSRQIVVVSVPETTNPEITGEAGKPVAVILDKDEAGQGRILQAPDKLQSADGDGRLALKLVDYDDQGAVKLSGEAPPGVPVRIYIDNEPAALVIGDSKGYWITTLDRDLPGGDYTLRLDQLDEKGETVARLETPFTRVTAPPVEGQAKVDYVIVQPGNSLWRIARRLSGDGFNYVYLFEANQAQIRDPNVIYPGQVFEVPPGRG